MNLRRRQLRAPDGLPPLLRESPMAQSIYLREQAERCRRLARSTSDSLTRERLLKLAAEYEGQADAQDGADEEAPAVRYGRRGEEDDD